MDQLKLLWEYQRLDILMDQYESERRKSPLRHKLIKLRNYLVQQQDGLIKLNDEADKKNHAFKRIKHEYETAENFVKTEREKLEKGEVRSIKQLEHIEKNLLDTKAKIEKEKEELNALLAVIERIAKDSREIGIKINTGKKEYEAIKEKYDGEAEKYEQQCGSIKERQAALKDKLDKALINKYENLKSSRSPAVVTIDHDRCGGCNMSLASLVIQNVMDRQRVVECENCGRILFVGETEDAS